MAALAACAALGEASAVPRPLTAACHFETPALQTSAAGVTRVTVSGCSQWVRSGQPTLPFRTLRLALPPGFTATGVTARAASPAVTLPGAWQLESGRTPTALATPPPAPPAPLVAAAPDVLAELVSVQRMAGYAIAVIRVFPLQYASALQRLDFTADVAVELALSPSPDRAIPPSPRPAEQQRVLSAVDNPATLSGHTRSLPLALDAPATNYLLVTRAALLPSFGPLLAQKQAAGLTVHAETMETITNSFAGVDAAERLRAFIRHAYTNWGAQYVLLGGDSKVVPFRGAYARCSGVTWTLMPTDLYFACLDGSWNHDGDGIWGEPTDGETGGDVDLLPEVCVGRAPVETAEEVTNFVARCLAAEQSPAARFRACFAGEVLNGDGAQGGDALDTLWPDFDNSRCPVAWLDDRPSLAPAWTAADALAALNRSPLLVAHFGHGTDYGYDTTALRLTVADLAALTNASPFLLYSTACNTGAFDNNFGMADCMAEELVKRGSHGAFAVLANSREGWYDDTVESRYSGEFQARFFARLLADAQVPVGLAHQLAKQDLLGSVETFGSDMPYRWCAFGLTLFGDPHQAVRVPLSLRLSVTSGERVVTWNSWAGRTYRVLRSTSLTSPGSCIASNVLAVPPVNVCTDAVPGLGRAFYRVVADSP